jgi:hypothetical protein
LRCFPHGGAICHASSLFKKSKMPWGWLVFLAAAQVVQNLSPTFTIFFLDIQISLRHNLKFRGWEWSLPSYLSYYYCLFFMILNGPSQPGGPFLLWDIYYGIYWGRFLCEVFFCEVGNLFRKPRGRNDLGQEGNLSLWGNKMVLCVFLKHPMRRWHFV